VYRNEGSKLHPRVEVGPIDRGGLASLEDLHDAPATRFLRGASNAARKRC
jgi:hypothetical protein